MEFVLLKSKTMLEVGWSFILWSMRYLPSRSSYFIGVALSYIRVILTLLPGKSSTNGGLNTLMMSSSSLIYCCSLLIKSYKILNKTAQLIAGA